MSYPRRFSNEQIINAYKQTGSVWRAAKLLGCVGQSVWERLRALGYRMPGQAWTDQEIGELISLAETCTVGETARRLGRTYASVASKASQLQISMRVGASHARKAKRGSGLTKRVVEKLISELRTFGGTLRQFCIQRGLDLEAAVLAIQRTDEAFWIQYVKSHSELNPALCPQCQREYIPMTRKQSTCSRRCTSLLRMDRKYFGGKRSLTVGLAEGICQLCEKETTKLSSHHMFGKENDPGNDFLLAVCSGCHQIIGKLGVRKDVEKPAFWENLIALAIARRLGHRKPLGFHVIVEIDELNEDDIEQDLASEELAV